METKVKTEKYPDVNLKKWESVNVLRLNTAGDFGKLEAMMSHISDMAKIVRDDNDLNPWDKDRLNTIVEKADTAEEMLISMFKRLNYTVSSYEL
jgi:hypothetical protein